MVTKRKASTTQSKKTTGASSRGAQKSARLSAKAKPAAAKAAAAKSAKGAPAKGAPAPMRPAQPTQPVPATPAQPTPAPAPAQPVPPMRPMPTASARQAHSGAASPTTKRVLPAKPTKPLRRRRKWPWVVGAFVLVIALAVGLFAWNRWWRYDDAQDFLGNWLANDTTSLVVIDDTTIRIADDVAYDYTIDPVAKTITYTFGSMKGSGRYWFSEDRQQLMITDGDTYSALSTLLDDVSYDAEQLKRSVLGQSPLKREPQAGVTLLSREGANGGVLPTRPTDDGGLEPDEAFVDEGTGAADGDGGAEDVGADQYVDPGVTPDEGGESAAA
ncbi:hypothetical protein [Adlercreutzia agrestimuris]|uniref:hypothetical protein n=1 Tax=Adlercreutzia agrestimuris TaxID=2941324 RepID=UPI00203F05B8|nr:hypothetical protein [Adlercreutzia agrestimuris]